MEVVDGNSTDGTETPLRRTRVTITIASLALWGSSLVRDKIDDCEVQSECFAPGEHHSISSGLFASVFKLDLDPVRELAGRRQIFVRMFWGIGHKAAPQFQTALLLTEDAGGHVRFTHGLDMESQLDEYIRKLTVPRTVPVRYTTELDLDMDEPSSTYDWGICQEEGNICDDREYIPQRLGSERAGHIADHPSTLRPTTHTCDNCSPSWSSETTSAEDRGYDSSLGTPYTTREAAFSPGAYDGDEEWEDVEVNRQILDETLHRDWRDAELPFQTSGDMTAARALLPPSMNGAQTLGPSGSPWVLDQDVQRWYWVDKDGQAWWHPETLV